MRIDNFAIIIGSAKLGITSLFNYLSEHPAVASCCKKESHFFSEPRIFKRGFDYYQSLWNWNQACHKIALEATPNYTRVTHEQLLNAAEKILETQAKIGVKFKFICIMRDPVQRIESHYTHIEAWNQEPNVQPLAQRKIWC